MVGPAKGAVAVMVALGGCAPAARSDVAPVAAPAAVDARQLAGPGPAPRGRSAEDAAALNRTCEECHVEIGREWRGSLHAGSHTDAAYQRALALEPLEFCQGCHAPEADPRSPVPEAAANIGVGCVTCHVLSGQVLAGRRAGERWLSTASLGQETAPHPVLRDARLEAARACAGCHEFAFPDRSARGRPELMQATVSEHARSRDQDRPCASCHMPRIERGGAGHLSHAFAGGHDRALVQSAVTVSAARTADRARISLSPRSLGHAFPTGDLFRRLEVSAEALGPEWQVVASARRFLTRHWERQPSPFGVVLRRAIRDDRPLAATVVVDLELGPAATGLPIAWRVVYQRVEHPRSEREQDSDLEGEIEIGHGTLETEP